jgi:hypothetical protein
VDQLTPGSKTKFYLMLNGSEEKAKDLEYDIHGCTGPANCELFAAKFSGSFEATNLSNKYVFFEFRHNGNATDWRQVIQRPDGSISDTGLVKIRRPGAPRGGIPEYQVPGIFQTLTNDLYRIPDVISSAGVDLFALVYTDLYIAALTDASASSNHGISSCLAYDKTDEKQKPFAAANASLEVMSQGAGYGLCCSPETPPVVIEVGLKG